jgi:GrpB-like predicted nucleotidyltransferase (UPF0157 family)
MIIIINGLPGEKLYEVSRELSHLAGHGVFIDARELIREQEECGDSLNARICQGVVRCKGSGFETIVIGHTFLTVDPLVHLKEILADKDDVIYSFRFTNARVLRKKKAPGIRDITPLTQSELHRVAARTQEKEALKGDLGFPVETGLLTDQEIAGIIWDNITEEVRLLTYDPAWARVYQEEEARIRKTLGKKAISIHHIGSTSVPGLAAKPIIDIMVTVTHLIDANACIRPLKNLGYIFTDYIQNRDRRFFRKGIPRTHHLHIVEEGSLSLVKHLTFRDLLRRNRELAGSYDRLKCGLCGRFRNNRAEYSSSKGAFIREALEGHRDA